MSRPKTRNSELTPLFILHLKRTFVLSSLLQAKKDLGFNHWSDNKWYKAVDGESITSEDAYDIERALISYIRRNANQVVEDLQLADMLEENASPDRNKDPN